MANTLYPQLQAFTLYSSGASIGDTTLVLSSMKTIDGVQLTMANFGDKGFITIDPGAGDLEEQISFSGLTANANGTTTLSGVKTVLCLSPYTETSGLAKQHSGGSTAVVAITSGLLNQFANKGNTETITAIWTHSTSMDMGGNKITSLGTPTANTDAATKDYADSLTYAGAPDADEDTKGIIELATNAEMGTHTSTGSTGARLVPPNDQLVKTSSGAADENKIAVLDSAGQFANGFLDKARTWSTVQSFTANNCQVTTDADSANDAVRKSYLEARMFGDGSDGALAVTSGTTTLTTDKIWQYTSISVSAGATLTIGGAADNLPLSLLCTGNVQIDGTINLAGKGMAGGSGSPAAIGGVGTAGAGFVGFGAGGGGGEGKINDSDVGNAGGNASGYTGGPGGTGTSGYDGGAGGSCTASVFANSSSYLKAGIAPLAQGAGGGAGGGTNVGSNVAGAAGGRGGGALRIAAAGNVVVSATGVITCAGAVGSNGGNNGNVNGNYGAGGGGGGGTVIIEYGGTYTNSGSVTVAGGDGGTVTSPVGASSGAGGKGSAGLVSTMKVGVAI